MELCVMALSGKIGYFTGDPLRLLEDAQLLKPNFFPSVPRVLNRVYQAAMLAADVPGLKGALFRKAIQVKLDQLHSTGHSTHMFWDKLVFRKVRIGSQVLHYKMSSNAYPGFSDTSCSRRADPVTNNWICTHQP
jgi:long-chain acyl-CoA synthetase